MRAVRSVQACPVKNPYVVGIQVEALREQSAQLPGAARRLKRVPQLNHAAPLARVRLLWNLCACGHEVRVVARGHGSSVVGMRLASRDRFHKSTKLHKGPLAT